MTVYSKKNRVIINNEKSSAKLSDFGHTALVYKNFWGGVPERKEVI